MVVCVGDGHRVALDRGDWLATFTAFNNAVPALLRASWCRYVPESAVV